MVRPLDSRVAGLTPDCVSAAKQRNCVAVSCDARFTKYLTIYRKIIVRSTYDSDLKRAKTSFRKIVS